MMWIRPGAVVALIACLLTACAADSSQDPASREHAPLAEIERLEQFPGRLSEGSHPDDAYQRPRLAEVTALDDERVTRLLRRLEALPAEADDELEFALRPASEPPPRTGAVIQGEFPPPEQLRMPEPDRPDGPLQVLRFGPEGEVPVAGQVSVTFDRPMVAVTAHDDLAHDPAPVELSPDIPGRWRWVGTRTVVFEAEAARLPMATSFSVTVPAGATAADGSALEEDLQWQFATPPVSLAQIHPQGGGIGLYPLMVAVFDQRIEAADMLDQLEVIADGEPVAVRLATDEEIGNDKTVARLVEQLQADRHLVFRAQRPFQPSTGVSIRLPAGSTAAEGPRPTETDQQKDFRTYGPLLVTDKRCASRDCRPTDALVLSFSNDLDPDQDFTALVEVDPPVADLHVSGRGRQLSIEGVKQGRTRYMVYLDESLADVFGQSLTGARDFRFETGSMHAQLSFPGRGLVKLAAGGLPELQYFTVNYRDAHVQVRRVQTNHWPDYVELFRGRQLWDEKRPELPGEVLLDQRVELNDQPDRIARQHIDFSPWLGDARTGQFVVLVEPGRTIGPQPRWAPRRHVAWVQITGMGLDASVDGSRLLVWATDLDDGAPLAGIEAGLDGGRLLARTDADGLASLELAERSEIPGGSRWVEARLGDDVVFLPEAEPQWRRQVWRGREQADQVLWYVFDDRAMYRPGETVHLKGWIRREQRGPDGDLGLIGSQPALGYRVVDARGNELADGSGTVGQLGGFDLSFDLPDTPNLGTARVELWLGGTGGLGSARHHHAFQIQEFRTPEFEVRTRLPQEGPHVGERTVTAEVEAAYYAGGALPGAEVQWTVTARPGHYRPPGRDDWSFGMAPPWWMPRPMANGPDQVLERFEGRTDGSGTHRLDIELAPGAHARALAMSARATVIDIDRQAWSAASDFISHPAGVYVGMKTDRQFVEQGESLIVDLITVDLDGEIRAGRPISVEAARIEWQWRSGGGSERRADVQRCEVTSDDNGLARCEFTSRLGGQYRITALTRDEQDRPNASQLTRWAGGARLPAVERVEMEEALLIPERETFRPGDTARVLVQAPFENAEGLLTLRRHGIAFQQRFSVDGSSTTLEIALREHWMPGIEMHVTLVGRSDLAAQQGRDSRPAIATATATLPISTAERALTIDLAPDQPRMAPGGETGIEMQVRDVAGRPVRDAEVALVVVDEAILALSDYRLVDPLGVFYRQRPGEVTDHHSRPHLLLPSPPALDAAEGEVTMEAAMAADDVESRLRTGALPPDQAGDLIEVREDFNPLAAFVPALITDGEGRASATVRLPDNLTRYRIMAVAVAGATHYGIAESAITARLPLMVRPAAPRFLNFGDRFDLPVVLQNQTDETLPVAVALDVSNLEITGVRGWALEVPPNDRVEVRFPAAAVNAGTARFQVAAEANGYTDAARGQLPVWTPATTEAFATYGVIEEGAVVQPVATPGEVWPQFGQLEITTSATALQSLTDAFIWLCEYPFTATEALASRLLAIAALSDVLEAFGAEDRPERAEIERIVETDLQALAARQNSDGGFGLWIRGEESWPFVTLHVAHALVRMQARGHEIDAALYRRTLDYVERIERHIPSRYSEQTRRHVIAYSLYVRGLTGDVDRSRARALIAEAGELDELTFESIGWLLGVLTGDPASAGEVTRLRRFLGNRVTETAAAAHFVRDWHDGDHLILHSARRADAIILEALMADQPDSDLIPKIVHGLQAHRTRGRWSSTQENAFVLLALDQYFRRYEDQEPDFIVRAWLGEDFAGQHRFAGRTTDSHQVDIPMSWLARASDPLDLVLAKDGAGRLYFRVGLSYAPRSLQLASASHGFEVERIYRGVDDENDVRRRGDGSWEIRAGARVAVDLTLVAPTRRYHVALVDPLPAGLESINPALAVSDLPVEDPDPQGRAGHRGWWGPWYRHQNLRDERTEAFTALLWGGVYNYTYYARATTPGEFVVPPARAEEMYHPETFGRSASDRVLVTD